MSSKSPLQVAEAYADIACSARPPSQADSAWRTDFPVDRVVLTLKLKNRSFVEKVQLRNYQASHVEVRGREGEKGEWRRSWRLVPKTEVRSMWDHKEGANPCTTHTLKVEGEAAKMSYGALQIAVLGNWEPPCELGLQSLTILGTTDPDPKPLPEPPQDPALSGPVVANPYCDGTGVGGKAAKPQPPSFIPPAAQPAMPKPPAKPFLTPASPKKKLAPEPPTVSSAPPAAPAGGAKKRAHNEDGPPVEKPLQGVVICLSGFKNPERSNLRSEACKLGAKCVDNWSEGGTHLVCAYNNTPKFQEVEASGRGSIVTKEWIRAASASRKRPDESLYELKKKTKKQ